MGLLEGTLFLSTFLAKTQRPYSYLLSLQIYGLSKTLFQSRTLFWKASKVLKVFVPTRIVNLSNWCINALHFKTSIPSIGLLLILWYLLKTWVISLCNTQLWPRTLILNPCSLMITQNFLPLFKLLWDNDQLKRLKSTIYLIISLPG